MKDLRRLLFVFSNQPPSLSEMSETASDAWSTDVLASDTDEKQSELLTDLDQVVTVGVGKIVLVAFVSHSCGEHSFSCLLTVVVRNIVLSVIGTSSSK